MKGKFYVQELDEGVDIRVQTEDGTDMFQLQLGDPETLKLIRDMANRFGMIVVKAEMVRDLRALVAKLEEQAKTEHERWVKLWDDRNKGEYEP